jgi:hypothetical protein
VTGLDVSASKTLPEVRTGPLGLAFLTRTKLLVTNAGGEAGQREVRVYVLPDDDSPLAADQFDHAARLSRSIVEPSDQWSIATTASAAYVPLAAVAGQGGILKAHHEANHLETLRAFVSPKSSGDLAVPAAVTVTPSARPQFLVVADLGSLDDAGDSRLMFYTLQSGSLALQLATGLNDVVGLAYSASGQLYAVDAAWNEPGQGGVYRLEDVRQEGRQACRAVKVASVPRGVSLAFAPDGALYVTSLGPSERTKQGALLKITGEF